MSVQEVICVLGMHRSGTSMVARLLRSQGVYLGADDELLAPQDDNPFGYFEHSRILQINTLILSHLGGSVIHPPKFGEQWWKRADLESLRSQACEVIKEFSFHPLWGWKDPRTSLLVPFWLELIPNLRFVICVRNPLEVALSLKKRQGMPVQQSAQLWHRYMVHAIRDTQSHSRIFVHYSDILCNSTQQIERLAHFCGVTPSEPSSVTKTAVQPHLRHHQSRLSDLLEHPDISEQSKLLYTGLRGLFSESTEFTGEASKEAESVHCFYRVLQCYEEKNLVPQMWQITDELQTQVEKLRSENEELLERLASVRRSWAWRFVSRLEHAIERLLPRDTRRRQCFSGFIRTVKHRVTNV